MHVLLIRHAATRDGALDAHGARQARALGDRLRWYDCAPARVWASPTGITTAETIAAVLTHPPHVEAAGWLAHADAIARIAAAACAELIAICADEPALSALASRLLDAPFAPLVHAQAARIVDGRVRWRFAWNADASEPARS